MAWPLIWLGGVALGALALAEEKSRRDRLNLDRRLGKLSPEDKKSGAALTPSALLRTDSTTSPAPGSIVCCHVYGVIEHTGIWLGDDMIAELHGSGLIRAVSPRRFLAGRTGDSIFVAATASHEAMAQEQTAKRAMDNLFTYRDYDLLENNCHRFVWYCMTGEEREIRSFDGFNEKLSLHFGETVFWDQLAA